MDKWQYLTTIIRASIDNERYQEAISVGKMSGNVPKYSVNTLMVELDAYGSNGWELVHMEPVQLVGQNGDIGYATHTMGGVLWSNQYFCVFKKKA